ncbi:MAG: glutamate-1-semialdehyde 2,1-aminomutase [Verrucomicrobia bacterium]|nr:glutamate-1-semialdehyde 2,1-aminomutase [Verrucomicrobiota bacterium]
MMIAARPKSEEIYAASLKRMPGGVNSPVRAFKGFDMTPMVVERGKGDTIWDVDGNAYIDYCLSWGPLILGHAHPAVVKRACEQMERGSSFGIATPYEFLLAEKINAHLPTMEKLRFVSSGSEATMSAIRLARGFTGRNTLVKFSGHYHGHSDCLLIQAGSGVTHLPKATSKGIPDSVIQHTVCLPFNDLAACRSYIRNHPDIAAVILEPVAGNMGVVPAEQEFVDMLREETAACGALLIFDEVITGFRVGLRGAQEYYRIKPDLTCLGKVIGGGYPVAAFGGRKEIMDMIAPLGAVYQGGTLSGNPVAMCAGLETLSHVEQEGFYENLEKKTRLLTDPIEHYLEQNNVPALLTRVGSMFTLFFGVTEVKGREDLAQLDEAKFKGFFQYLFERGIYAPPSAYEAWFVSSAHTEENLLYTRDTVLAFLKNQC